MSRKLYLDGQVEKAIDLQKRGQLHQAVTLCSEVAREDPRHIRALYLLGVCWLQLGDAQKAVGWLDRMVAVSSRIPQAFIIRGAAYRAIGRNDQALLDYDRALALDPNLTDALFNKANALRFLKRHGDAVACYVRASEIAPKRMDILNNLAGTLTEMGDWRKADAVFSRILQQEDSAQANYNLGLVKSELGLFHDAIKCFDNAVRLKPDYAEAFSGRAHAFGEIGEHQSALNDCSHAISLDPDFADAYLNSGKSLACLRRHDEALAMYEKAISLGKDDFAARYNRGLALRELGRSDEARRDFDKAMALSPANAEAGYAKAHLLLHDGEYVEGFRLYRSRWGSRSFAGSRLNTDVPEWDGQPFPGNLLLWAEQGVGDEIFYASLLSLLPSDQMRITLAADRRLHPIFARSFPDIRLIDRSTQAELAHHYDAQAAMGDLGGILKIDEAGIGQRRYPFLEVNAPRQRELRNQFRTAASRPLVGMSWASANRKTGSERSIDLARMAPLLHNPQMRFVSLQYGDVAAEVAAVREAIGCAPDIPEGLDAFNDLDGLLALIGACDVVVTIDNVTAHLAGSIGKRAVVLLPLGRGEIWYWQGRPISSWYPSLELIYQHTTGDWDAAIRTAAERVAALAVISPR